MTFSIAIPQAVGPEEFLAYAYRETDAANSFLLKLGSLAGSLTPPTINPNFPSSPAAPPLSLPAPPVGASIVWTAPSLPSAFSGSITVDDILPAPFEDDPPTLVFGVAPAAFTDIAPDAPGIDINFDIPDLTVDLPAAPSLLSINVTKFDGVNIPTLDVTIPELTIDAPSIREYTPGAQYTSGLLTSAQVEAAGHPRQRWHRA
jgi:hypothetical protein